MTSETEIRPATPADLDTVTDLIAAQLAEHDIPLARADLAFAVEGILRMADRGFVLLAERGGETAGVACVSFTWTVERGGAVAWLDELYVVPAHRNGGVGGALLSRVLEQARAEGVRAVELEVEASHADAERLYTRHGFELLPRRRWTRFL